MTIPKTTVEEYFESTELRREFISYLQNIDALDLAYRCRYPEDIYVAINDIKVEVQKRLDDLCAAYNKKNMMDAINDW